MTGHREAIRSAIGAALGAVDPAASIRRYCNRQGEIIRLGDEEAIDLGDYERIVVVGAGKASVGLVAGLHDLLADRPLTGAVVTRQGYLSTAHSTAEALPPGLRIAEAGHPLPDERSIAAADQALELAGSCGPKDLLVCLLSGGASALWAAPPHGISLQDLRDVTKRLLRSGAPIEEMNTVRKQVTRIAGGRLARASDGARLITLAISDVVGAPPDVIGSGPTLPDASTPDDALDVLRRYRVEAPPSVLLHLERTDETGDPALGDAEWSLRSFHVIASVNEALDAAARSLTEAGYHVEIRERDLQGEARDVGRQVARAAIEARSRGARRLALLHGGETTVTVTGSGTGGRNQEIALAAAIELGDQPDITIASVATDGTDGLTDAAGGFADSGTVSRASARGYDALASLRANDSYPLLNAAGDLIVTGPTGTNVNDLVLALVG